MERKGKPWPIRVIMCPQLPYMGREPERSQPVSAHILSLSLSLSLSLGAPAA
jgi:hypothetical protein